MPHHSNKSSCSSSNDLPWQQHSRMGASHNCSMGLCPQSCTEKTNIFYENAIHVKLKQVFFFFVVSIASIKTVLNHQILSTPTTNKVPKQASSKIWQPESSMVHKVSDQGQGIGVTNLVVLESCDVVTSEVLCVEQHGCSVWCDLLNSHLPTATGLAP